ncbi:dihydroorotase [Flavobacterium agricola]|uniref:Dihydroorotase n=1 Tax=Flavobacterium agricola TaxID=2870839 RepID=A0ABY6M1V6_9FLAO|nr:dihydroorotase [Flavobacterium agricola]UYW02554.1 dihydroorotase [Flavobacterium agricola]
MNVILKNAKVIDAHSPFHNQQVDIKIKDGVLVEIAASIANDSEYQTVNLPNLHVSPGWFDSSVSFGEPGYEDRETIANGLQTAAKSGFTSVALQPNSNPVIDNQSQIYFVKNKAQNQATDLYPIGAFTKNAAGTDMAEMFDMQNAGAVAFGDYQKSTSNANLLKIGLQYVQDFDGLLIAFAQDKTIKGNGVVHEGIVSTTLGLKGIPPLAEEIEIARNLFLLEYTGGKLHIPTVSTAQSVALIKQAKAKGLHVTCSVAVHNLVLTDAILTEFDTRAKVMPPVRDEKHREALIQGVLDGTIDVITSDHNPLDIELKKMEFDVAQFGTIGLESAYVALQTVLPTEVIVKKLTAGKTIFKLENNTINTNQKANLSLFTPNGDGIFTKANILSKSKNSIFLNQPVKGKVYGIYNNKTLITNE